MVQHNPNIIPRDGAAQQNTPFPNMAHPQGHREIKHIFNGHPTAKHLHITVIIPIPARQVIMTLTSWLIANRGACPPPDPSANHRPGSKRA